MLSLRAEERQDAPNPGHGSDVTPLPRPADALSETELEAAAAGKVGPGFSPGWGPAGMPTFGPTWMDYGWGPDWGRWGWSRWWW